MSVVGFDLSTDIFRVAVLPSDKVIFQEVKDKEDQYGTPAAICFEGNQRTIGRHANGRGNVFSEVMKIIGRNKSDLKANQQLSNLLVKSPDGLLRVCLSGLKEKTLFAPIELLAMVLSDLKFVAESALEVDSVKECCIAIPAYCSKSQRTAVHQAAQIAGFDTISVIPAIVATAWGHGIIRKKVPKKATNPKISEQDSSTNTSNTSKEDTIEDHIIAVVDIDSDCMQIAIFSLKSNTLDVLSYECNFSAGELAFVDILLEHFNSTSVGNHIREDCQRLMEQSKRGGKLMYAGKEMSRAEFQRVSQPVLDNMKELFQKAVTHARKQVNDILVTGSGSKVYGVSKLLESLLPKQAGAAQKQLLSANFVAKGCAIFCAIRTKALVKRAVTNTYKSLQDCLLNFEVTDKWPPAMESQVAKATYDDDGRTLLTFKEVIVAREWERKMVMREKLRLKIPDILKLNEYAKEDELERLKNANNQLDSDDLDDVHNRVMSVEKNIMARKNERDCHTSTSTVLECEVKKYEDRLVSLESEYRTIKQTSKDSLKQKCEEIRKWLKNKEQILSQLKKNDDPICFINDAALHMKSLEQAWVAAQLQRDPEIEKLTYRITDSTFHDTIDNFRQKLLEGTPEINIMGCRLLPYQPPVKGPPYKWFQVKLLGREDEFTVLHVKQHNVYNLGFNNMEGQPYEMGPGRNNEGKTDEMKPRQPNSDADIGEIIKNLTIVGAKFVGFQCDYLSMVDPNRSIEDKTLLMEKFEAFKVGIDPFLDGIHVLGYHGCANHDHVQCLLCSAPDALPRSVFCISVMLNECTRMNALKQVVGDNLSGMLLYALLMQYIWHWCPMSLELRRWAADNKQREVPKSLSTYILATCIIELGTIVFLVLNETFAKKKKATSDHGSSSRQSPSSGGGDDGDKKQKKKKKAAPPSTPSEPGHDGAKGKQSQSEPGHDGADRKQKQSHRQLGPGQNLLHIFSVTPKGVNPSNICGILVHDHRGAHTIYMYGSDNASGVQLSGPNTSAISPQAGCTLEVIPKEGNRYGATEDRLIDLEDGTFRYDALRLKTIPFGGGEVRVSYVILTEAVEANLRINLQLPLNEQTYKVSGTLLVSQQHGDTMLTVGPTESVPVKGLPDLVRSRPVQLSLSRSVFAVKLGDSVKIEGLLFVGGHELNICGELQIPPEVDIIKNVKTEREGAYPYSLGMLLISRNI